MMNLLILLIGVVLAVAVIIWLLDQLPIDGKLKQIIRVAVILVALLIVLMQLLPVFGIYT